MSDEFYKLSNGHITECDVDDPDVSGIIQTELMTKEDAALKFGMQFMPENWEFVDNGNGTASPRKKI